MLSFLFPFVCNRPRENQGDLSLFIQDADNDAAKSIIEIYGDLFACTISLSIFFLLLSFPLFFTPLFYCISQYRVRSLCSCQAAWVRAQSERQTKPGESERESDPAGPAFILHHHYRKKKEKRTHRQSTTTAKDHGEGRARKLGFRGRVGRPRARACTRHSPSVLHTRRPPVCGLHGASDPREITLETGSTTEKASGTVWCRAVRFTRMKKKKKENERQQRGFLRGSSSPWCARVCARGAAAVERRAAAATVSLGG